MEIDLQTTSERVLCQDHLCVYFYRSCARRLCLCRSHAVQHRNLTGGKSFRADCKFICSRYVDIGFFKGLYVMPRADNLMSHAQAMLSIWVMTLPLFAAFSQLLGHDSDTISTAFVRLLVAAWCIHYRTIVFHIMYPVEFHLPF